MSAVHSHVVLRPDIGYTELNGEPPKFFIQGESTRMSQADQPAVLIELREVSKYYADGDVRALQKVRLVVRQGEYITVVGPSGCGKSTLLHILGALDMPSEGEVLFRGMSVRQWNLNRLRSKEIGFVFQSFYLLPNLTALENVQLPMFGGGWPASKRSEEARRLLAIVGLEQRLHHLPNQLSVGQRQRVAIARALANSPALILADEPTGSLDSSSGREVMELLIRLNEQHQTTLIVVTHDPSIASGGRRKIRMLDGFVVDDAWQEPQQVATQFPGGSQL